MQGHSLVRLRDSRKGWRSLTLLRHQEQKRYGIGEDRIAPSHLDISRHLSQPTTVPIECLSRIAQF
jgi:hypothetical protein